MREHDNEPVPGLPELLPEGERILWQGAPCWTALANKALHVRTVAVYLALLVAWGGTSAFARHETTAQALAANLKLTIVAAAAIAGLSLFAYLIARTTVYTITTKRVVMRFGVALPITINVPLSAIEAADLKVYRDGTGDIPLSLGVKERQSMTVLWPHVRPWHMTKPQPMLRGIPKACDVANLLSGALKATHAGERTLAKAATSPFAGERAAPASAPVAA